MGLEVQRTLKVFEVHGLVVDSFLRADAYAHTIRVELQTTNIDRIKKIVQTAPLHVESGYQWPFDCTIAKFTSKLVSKEKLAHEFEPILDGRGIDLKNFTGCFQDLTIRDVVEGVNVLVEYIPIFYFGGKPGKKEGEDSFPPGCTLKLVSITLLEAPAQLDTSIRSKRRRVI